MALEMETLQRENKVLKHRNASFGEDVAPSHNEQTKADSREQAKPRFDDEEKKKMYDELCNLMEKYEEITRRIGASSSIN